MLKRAERPGDQNSGAAVFPGGLLDASDRGHYDRCEGMIDATASARMGLAQHGLHYWVAAVRECFEEAGLLFANDASGTLVDLHGLPPAEVLAMRHALHANQTEVKIKVFQGESRKVKDNLLLGEFMVKGIPRGPAGQEIDVRFTYDLNGVLEVEAVVVETQHKISLVITKHVKGLSEEQIARAVAQMNDLKTHPREETVNRFLLKRAERVYRELPLMERERLADLVDGFEDALEVQDPAAIDRFRDALEQYLALFEQSFQDDPHGDEDEPW